MGSLCTGRPATTTTTTAGSNKSAYTPTGLDQLNDIWGRVSSAASTPYSPYGGQMVADLNPVQLAGISNINDAYGVAQPYFDTAAGYARTGAAPISATDVQRYISPYTQNVIDATRANFAEDNARQQSQVTGNAALRNALGGDRVGVAQAETARQQRIAQDPVIAGMYDRAYTQAMSAAQADRAAAAQGAYTFGALAPSVQNARIQGGQAQIGAGSVAQNNDQARLTAQYNQYLQALAFPYQQASFLTSAGLPAINAMGGSQTGTSAGNSVQVAQPPQASPLSQIAGLGLTGIGLMSGLGGFSGLGGMFGGGANPSSSAYGSNPFTPYGTVNPAYGWRGGRMNGTRASGGRVNDSFMDTVNTIRQALRGGGSVVDHNSQFGWVENGNMSPFEIAAERTRRSVVRPRFADGGDVGFDDRFGAIVRSPYDEPSIDPVQLQDSHVAQFGVPTRAYAGFPSAEPVQEIPMPRPRPANMGPSAFALPPQITNPGGGAVPIMLPQSAMALDTPAVSPYGAAPVAPVAAVDAPINAPLGESPSTPFGLSEDARMGLIAAGLGMMGSRNPNALGAIGEGGLTGVKAYAQNRNSRQRNELAARKLIQDAEQFAKGHELRKDTLGETKRYHDMTAEERAEARKQRAQDAKDRSEDRRDNLARTAYPGEGVDEDGKTVKGMYQFNPETREYDFKPGKTIQKGAGAGAKPGAVEQLADRLVKDAKERGQELTFQEAVGLAKRAPNNQEQLKRETLALTAAKNDMGYLRDPVGTLEKWRKQYGLGPAAAPTSPAPKQVPAPPQSNLKTAPPEVIEKAKAAIAKGAPREAVLKRLQDAGLDTSGI